MHSLLYSFSKQKGGGDFGSHHQQPAVAAAAAAAAAEFQCSGGGFSRAAPDNIRRAFGAEMVVRRRYTRRDSTHWKAHSACGGSPQLRLERREKLRGPFTESSESSKSSHRPLASILQI